jgi:D-threo-aldose 1-dehydrogenase
LAGGSNYNYKMADESLIYRREQINSRCQEYGVALSAAALQFTASHPAVTSVIVGARNAAEVQSLITSSHATIPAELWDRLRADHLIPEEAPTPR